MLLTALLAGLFAAGVLSLGHVLDIPVPCGGSLGCATVAAHSSSKLLEIPIAYFGAAAYVVLLGLLSQVDRRRWARGVFVAIAGSGTAVSAGLLAYSQAVIGASCSWCVVSGFSMLLAFLFGILLLKRDAERRRLHPGLVATVSALTLAAVAVQGYAMHRASLVPPVAMETLAELPEHELVAGAQALGRPDAPVTLIAFTDLWCSACRAVHPSLLNYQQTNPAGVRLAYRHLPLWNIRGHESSGIAAAMAEMAGEQGKFWDFVHALLELPRPPNKEGYLALMENLGFDRSMVERRFDDPEDPAIARVQRDMALAEELGINATPTFFILIGDKAPVSASQRTLPDILNAPEVLLLLQEAAQKVHDNRPATGNRLGHDLQVTPVAGFARALPSALLEFVR